MSTTTGASNNAASPSIIDKSNNTITNTLDTTITFNDPGEPPKNPVVKATEEQERHTQQEKLLEATNAIKIDHVPIQHVETYDMQRARKRRVKMIKQFKNKFPEEVHEKVRAFAEEVVARERREKGLPAVVEETANEVAKSPGGRGGKGKGKGKGGGVKKGKGKVGAAKGAAVGKARKKA